MAKTNFNNFLKECEEDVYNKLETNRNVGRGVNTNANIFLNSNHDNEKQKENEKADASKLVINDENFPSLSSMSSSSSSSSSSQVKNFKDALKAPPLQKPTTSSLKKSATVATSLSDVAAKRIKMESERFANKIISLRKPFNNKKNNNNNNITNNAVNQNERIQAYDDDYYDDDDNEFDDEFDDDEQ